MDEQAVTMQMIISQASFSMTDLVYFTEMCWMCWPLSILFTIHQHWHEWALVQLWHNSCNDFDVCHLMQRISLNLQKTLLWHHSDVTTSPILSQITGKSTVCSKKLFRRSSTKTAMLRVTGLSEENPPVTGGSTGDQWIPLHKGPVTYKIVAFDDVIMIISVL